MSRLFGTISRGVRAPIINEGDDIVDIVVNAVLDASKEEGVAMAKAGEIQGVGVAHRKDSEYLKSLPDGTEGNNLGNLPSVSGYD